MNDDGSYLPTESSPWITPPHPLLAPAPSPAQLLHLSPSETPATCRAPQHWPWILHGVCTQEEMLSPAQHPQGRSKWAQAASPGPVFGSGHCPLGWDEHRLPLLEWLCNPSQTINIKFLKKHLPWFWLRVGTWCQQGKVAPSCFSQLVTFRFCCLSALRDGAICPPLTSARVLPAAPLLHDQVSYQPLCL